MFMDKVFNDLLLLIIVVAFLKERCRSYSTLSLWVWESCPETFGTATREGDQNNTSYVALSLQVFEIGLYIYPCHSMNVVDGAGGHNTRGTTGT
jgi:hypothetical protein